MVAKLALQLAMFNSFNWLGLASHAANADDPKHQLVHLSIRDLPSESSRFPLKFRLTKVEDMKLTAMVSATAPSNQDLSWGCTYMFFFRLLHKDAIPDLVAFTLLTFS